MGSSCSTPEAGMSLTAWDGLDAVDTSQPLNSGRPSSREEYIGDAEVAGTMTGGVVSNGSSGPGNEQQVTQFALQEGQQPELEATVAPEHGRGLQSLASHSSGSCSAASQHQERSLQEGIYGPCSQNFRASPVEDPYPGLTQTQPQHGAAASASHVISAAESSHTNHSIVESIETSETHPPSTVQGSQWESPMPSVVKIEESSIPEAPADNPAARITPCEEAEGIRDTAKPADDERHDVKRKCDSPETSPRKQPRSEEERTTVPTGAGRDESTAATFFTPLGSLSSFMETRGIAPQPQTVEKSQYFGESKPTDDANHMPSRDISPKQETQEEEASTVISQQIPRCHQKAQDPLILFLSTGLLKTHVPLVKYLETKQNPPALIYRDYGSAEEIDTKKSITNPGQTTPLDADIIISPSAGIVLTTSQATTQLYLPGHKRNPKVGEIACIDSPLRERIFLLAPRYEQLYIFVSHNMDGNQSQSQGSGSGKKPSKPTTDRRTLAAITSLTAFCNSASVYATITPLLIPSAPDALGEWVLSLAHKHAFTPSHFGDSGGNRSTPGNRSGIRIVPSAQTAEKASNWELFLRHAGMNPFAALTTLSIMRKAEREELASAGQTTSEYVYLCNRKRRVRSLSKFLEMESERRRKLLEDLVGRRVLRRVEAMIEQDWQCDWALDFYGTRSGA